MGHRVNPDQLGPQVLEERKGQLAVLVWQGIQGQLVIQELLVLQDLQAPLAQPGRLVLLVPTDPLDFKELQEHRELMDSLVHEVNQEPQGPPVSRVKLALRES